MATFNEMDDLTGIQTISVTDVSDHVDVQFLNELVKLQTESARYLTRYEKPSEMQMKIAKEKLRLDGMYEKEFKTTGSRYKGQWTSQLTMDGYGTYTFPHGVVYEGEFSDGQFHGSGKLIYPQGQVLEGTFFEGQLKTWRFTFKDGKRCNFENYCRFPDRQHAATGISQQSPREIPPGHYDVGDGFYNPKTLCIHDDQQNIVRISVKRQMDIKPKEILDDGGDKLARNLLKAPIYPNSDWIEAYCRKGWKQNTGYRPDLYEYWSIGRQEESEEISKKWEIEEKLLNEGKSNCLKLLHSLDEIINA